ncbi:MAG: Asp-tRNA(Asn)/Glu-tRNA(Gln) amidotransferase subunit GatC [Firmicutes bacterium]|nr:Asp-tRNA(Asn)/Glu-tRNA(Gln) amidotransferase subunit GatC [Bacillota bacterium]
MGLTDHEIQHVARLARLRLTADELPVIRRDLNRVLEYVSQLQTLDLANVEPTMHVVKSETPLRHDQVEPSLPVLEATRNAAQVEEGMFKVPRIMDSEGGGAGE